MIPNQHFQPAPMNACPPAVNRQMPMTLNAADSTSYHHQSNTTAFLYNGATLSQHQQPAMVSAPHYVISQNMQHYQQHQQQVYQQQPGTVNMQTPDNMMHYPQQQQQRFYQPPPAHSPYDQTIVKNQMATAPLQASQIFYTTQPINAYPNSQQYQPGSQQYACPPGTTFTVPPPGMSFIPPDYQAAPQFHAGPMVGGPPLQPLAHANIGGAHQQQPQFIQPQMPPQHMHPHPLASAQAPPPPLPQSQFHNQPQSAPPHYEGPPGYNPIKAEKRSLSIQPDVTANDPQQQEQKAENNGNNGGVEENGGSGEQTPAPTNEPERKGTPQAMAAEKKEEQRERSEDRDGGGGGDALKDKNSSQNSFQPKPHHHQQPPYRSNPRIGSGTGGPPQNLFHNNNSQQHRQSNPNIGGGGGGPYNTYNKNNSYYNNQQQQHTRQSQDVRTNVQCGECGGPHAWNSCLKTKDERDELRSFALMFEKRSFHPAFQNANDAGAGESQNAPHGQQQQQSYNRNHPGGPRDQQHQNQRYGSGGGGGYGGGGGRMGGGGYHHGGGRGGTWAQRGGAGFRNAGPGRDNRADATTRSRDQ